MDTRKQIEIDKIIAAFLAQMPKRSQTAAAKILNIPKKRFRDYYNHRYTPPEALLVQMECFLHTRGIHVSQKKPDIALNASNKLSASERVKQVLADEQWGKKRSGRPKKLKTIICPRDDKLNKKNRTDDRLAEKYQFKSRFTMRVAVLVVEKGCVELIQAMDREAISFKCAAKLALLPIPLQQELVRQNEQAIKNYFKAKKENSLQAKMKKAFAILQKHPKVILLEKKTQALFGEVLEEILYAVWG